MLQEMFEEVFEEVALEYGRQNWWEVYDSDLFDVVCGRISKQLGYDCWECTEFIMWQSEMGEDL